MNITSAVRLRGVNPTDYHRGAFIQEGFPVTGMWGFYSPDSGRYLQSTYTEALSGIAVGNCIGVLFGDGEEDFVQGMLAVQSESLTALIRDQSHVAELSAHVNYQSNVVPDASFSSTVRMSEAQETLQKMISGVFRAL